MRLAYRKTTCPLYNNDLLGCREMYWRLAGYDEETLARLRADAESDAAYHASQQEMTDHYRRLEKRA